MINNAHSKHLPSYHGEKWIRPGLPTDCRPWEEGKRRSIGKDPRDHIAVAKALRLSLERAPWEWPKRPIFFLADPHADAEAFVASLVASGGVRKNGPDLHDFKLSREGRQGRFIIGGDCLDKGPSNLQMLRTLRHFMRGGARVTLLAGNHDLRLMLGIRALDMDREPRTEHFFVRMGPKVVPLLKEIHDHYFLDAKGDEIRHALKGIPPERECHRHIFPSKRWFKEFPKHAVWMMADEGVERELGRMEKKLHLFEQACADAGLSMRMVYATARKCREIFFEPKGEFYWFYRKMELARREGSFLFIHAGFDDRIATILEDHGLKHLNRLYRDQIYNDPFEFYYGPLANTMRTKYRKSDMPLSRHGVEKVHRLGIHAVVHGHRNRTTGQGIVLRHGMLHIESDITMDRNSRRKEGLEGYGVGVTIIRPEGEILGVSTDFPHAKRFDPAAFLRTEHQ